MKPLKKKTKQPKSKSAKSQAAEQLPAGFQAENGKLEPKQKEFLEILSKAKKKSRIGQKTEMQFFSDPSQLKQILPKGAPLRLKLESKFFGPYFGNPNSAYAIRVCKKGKLSSMLAFVGKNAPEKEMRQLAEEIAFLKKWERRPIKTVNKIEL